MKSTTCIAKFSQTAARLPKEFDFPAFLGYSAGHWERDVFVVETAGFNDRTALDSMGHPTAKPCASRNASAAATSDTWMLK